MNLNAIAQKIASEFSRHVGMKYKIVTRNSSGRFVVQIFSDDLSLERAVRKLGGRKTGTVNNPRLRPELQGLPTFSNLLGPMWDGPGGARYETDEVYDIMST